MDIFITTKFSATFIVFIICFERKRKNTIKKAKRSTEKKTNLRKLKNQLKNTKLRTTKKTPIKKAKKPIEKIPN